MARCRSTSIAGLGLSAGLLAFLGLAVGGGVARSETPQDNGSGAPARQPAAQATQSLGANAGEEQQQLMQYTAGAAGTLLKTPVSNLYPGGVSTRPNLKNPVAGDPAAAERGMKYFLGFNCVGCHAANGGGGMGPALSNSFFIYGSDPANIYLSIVQGRPNGMPAWGASLPNDVVWDLVAYIQQISNEPKPEWGTTISAKSPAIEQVPAEFQTTTTPWSYTQPFSYGQKPEGRNGSK